MSMKAPFGIGKTGGGSDFFSSLKSGAADMATDFGKQALGSLATDVVPNWTKKQLDMQNNDQMDRSTFNRNESRKRVNDMSSSSKDTQAKINKSGVQGGTTQNALWDTYKGLNISGAAMALIVLAGGGILYAVLK